LYKTLNVIAEQYDNAIEKNKILQQNFENQKLSFERSEEKIKRRIDGCLYIFCGKKQLASGKFQPQFQQVRCDAATSID
jgi:hypothetical protein